MRLFSVFADAVNKRWRAVSTFGKQWVVRTAFINFRRHSCRSLRASCACFARWDSLPKLFRPSKENFLLKICWIRDSRLTSWTNPLPPSFRCIARWWWWCGGGDGKVRKKYFIGSWFSRPKVQYRDQTTEQSHGHRRWIKLNKHSRCFRCRCRCVKTNVNRRIRLSRWVLLPTAKEVSMDFADSWSNECLVQEVWRDEWG